MNRKKIGYICLLVFLLILANAATFAWLTMNFYGDLETIVKIAGVERSLNVAFWDTLSFKYKALTFAAMFAGYGISFALIKLFYKNNRQTKQIQQQQEFEEKKQDNWIKHMEKILEGKK